MNDLKWPNFANHGIILPRTDICQPSSVTNRQEVLKSNYRLSFPTKALALIFDFRNRDDVSLETKVGECSCPFVAFKPLASVLSRFDIRSCFNLRQVFVRAWINHNPKTPSKDRKSKSEPKIANMMFQLRLKIEHVALSMESFAPELVFVSRNWGNCRPRIEFAFRHPQRRLVRC